MAKSKRRTLPPDIPPDHWAAGAVDAGLTKGILRLDDDGTFQGDREASRFDVTYGLEVIRQRHLPPPPPPPGVRMWSDPWPELGGRTPTAFDDLVIPAGVVMEQDVLGASFLTLRIEGELHLSRTARNRLDAHGNVIVAGSGWFDAGTETDRILAPDYAGLRFVAVVESAFVGGGMSPIPTDHGLWVTDAGRLTVAGRVREAWLSLALPAVKGERQITLDGDPVGWEAGQLLSICPTELPNVSGYSLHFDEAIIDHIDGRTVYLDRDLLYDHPAVLLRDGRTFFAEVANLSSNVVIEGLPTGRAHIFIRSTVPQFLTDCLIQHMAPQKGGDFILGRYPMHFHHCHHGTHGSKVTRVVGAHSGGPMFVTHLSFGVTYTRAVAYDGRGNLFWWDDIETEQSEDVAYLDCLGALSTTTLNSQKHHSQLTAFSMTGGTRVTCTGCHGVGINGGKNSNAFRWPELSHGVWQWSHNVGHNISEDGIWTWQNDNLAHEVLDFVIYHCKNGIAHGAYDNVYLYKNGVIHGCLHSSIEVHALNKGGQSRRLTFENIVCDGLGLHDYAVIFPPHTDKVPVVTPGLFQHNQYYGYRKAAYAWTYDGRDGVGGPEVYDIVDDTYDDSLGGTEFWIGEILSNPKTVITVRDPVLGHLALRKYDAPVGQLKPEWNAKVETLP